MERFTVLDEDGEEIGITPCDESKATTVAYWLTEETGREYEAVSLSKRHREDGEEAIGVAEFRELARTEGN